MYQNKTQPTAANVTDYIAAVPDPQKRADALELVEMMQQVSGKPAVLWGTSLIGFGEYHYKYGSGHSGNAMRIGFSPRKAAISLYLFCGTPQKAAMLKKLGKHTSGVGCVYVKKLDDIDRSVLKELIKRAWEYMGETYPV